jgi:hypothetical protein
MVKLAETASTTRIIQNDDALWAGLHFRVQGRIRWVVDPPSRVETRDEVIARIPSATDLDLVAIDPPAEWLAERSWE